MLRDCGRADFKVVAQGSRSAFARAEKLDDASAGGLGKRSEFVHPPSFKPSLN
jgi:hypothetical protein